jgi:chromate reductase, NAD(P)H dehydrogenase (quinone)
MTVAAPLKLLGISESLRAQSYNTGALRAVGAPDHITFTVASLAPPSADVEQRGFQPTVDGFRKEAAAADALIFAVPEYNYSVSGVLKNALEWLSRPPNPPANGRPCAMFGASVSPLGTARGQFHYRHICVSLNMIAVNAPHVDIANAKSKFDSESRLVDQPSLDLLRQLLGELEALTLRLRRQALRSRIFRRQAKADGPVNGALSIAGRPMLRCCVSSAGPTAGLRRSSRSSR